jgi:alkaline phosphatase D
MRRSLLFLLALVAVCSLPSTASATGGSSVNFTHGIAAGDATQHKAVLWTRAVPTSGNPTVKVEVWKEFTLFNVSSCGRWFRVYSKNVKPLASRDYTIKVDASLPFSDSKYCYRFKSGSNETQFGHFKTAPRPHKLFWWHGDPRNGEDVHATFDGDQDGTGTFASPCCGTFDVLAQVQNANPDFYVSEGDNIYSDSSHRTGGPAITLADYRQAYKDTLTFPNLLNVRANIGQYSLMDDHEVYNDYEGETVDPARYAAGRQAFFEYMPIRETGLPQDSSCAGDPIYKTFKWGADVEVFQLDLRSCRSADVAVQCGGDLGPTLPPPIRQAFPFNLFLTPTPTPACLAALNDPSRTVLGPVQKAKFKNDLLASTARHKWVLNEYAIQQYHALPYDRWEGYPVERDEILDFIRDNGIDNVTFLTTDHHATIQNEVFKDRFTDPGTIAYDFVTGPVGTETLAQEIVGAFGPTALVAFQAILQVDGIDCKNLNQFSWGDVQYSTTANTTAIASRDVNGAPILDGVTPCVNTLPDPVP